jgi:hypothetical protein
MWYSPNGDEGFFGSFFDLEVKKERPAGEAIEEFLMQYQEKMYFKRNP